MAAPRLNTPSREHSNKVPANPTPLSFLQGPTEPPLRNVHLGQLLSAQAAQHGSKTAIVCSSSSKRLTYRQLLHRSEVVAKGLLARGIRHGQVIGILAGNCSEYVEIFFAAGRIGATLAVFNNTYTQRELHHALSYTDCKILFTASRLGKADNTQTLTTLESGLQSLPHLDHVIMLDLTSAYKTYSTFAAMLADGEKVRSSVLRDREMAVSPHDICNLQFTSGTTGSPKAAMLSHHNVINNAVFIGDRMMLSESDVLCCPPPLFHCFGLVLGLLAVVTHGCTIVFPNGSFDARATLDAVLTEGCTALHGVPAMWTAEMELVKASDNFSRLRTGIAAGSATLPQMMADLRSRLNLTELTNTYGMTETSPASFMTTCHDPLERRLNTVGKIMPHTTAKIIDQDGKVVPLGGRGELCISGYLLQKGYWRNPAKTNEVMIKDSEGTLWMHTGDEASFDAEGYCKITGRIKDMIIRGGENIFPLEIEERMMQHPAIINASVVGVADAKYGEAVAVFIEPNQDQRLTIEEIRLWVREQLGRHKAPAHVWYLGDKDVGDYFPLTGSGKVKKHLLRDLGNRLLKQRRSKL